MSPLLPLSTGVFWETADTRPEEARYRFDNAYYIRYNVGKALYALGKIASYSRASKPDVFLCHVHTDLLFEACGMIDNRFVAKPRMSEKVLEQVRSNVREYGFIGETYPLLSKNDFRNFIEHIDERGEYLIGNDSYFGTFNVIYAGMDKRTREGLTDTDEPKNNTLDLEQMTYAILDKEKNGASAKTISLNALKSELDSLKETADRVWDGLTNGGLFLPC